MNFSTRFGKVITGIFFAVIICSFSLQAGPVKLSSNSNEIRMIQNSDQGFKSGFYFSEFNTMDVKTPKGIFTRITVPAYSDFGQYGYPELPVKSELIEIPVNAAVRVDISSYSVREFKLNDIGINYPIMPNQPPVPKSGEIPEFVYNKDAYKVNQYGQAEIVSVEYLGNMRGVGIGRLDIRPVQYNPVTGTVRIYENIQFSVVFENADIAATQQNKQTYGNHYFSPVYNSLLNYREPANESRENFSRYPIKYVIVSDPMFESALQPFIEWKTKQGFTVVEAYTNDPNVGTTTSQIKSYLQNLYNEGTPEDPAPTFVLFVGDIAQVPTFTGQAAGHVTDLYYCEYTGDYFPEVFYGRFSAQNLSQLTPQVDKSLMYEQYTMPVTTYLDTVVMVAGMDGTYGPIHGNGQINYGTENYFNAAHGLYSHTYLYPESGSNAAQMRQNISDGVTYANYTAHGSPDGWADPSFSVSDIPALQNNGKYGLLVGNCCSTSEYQVDNCFGEAIVRAANKGAVGYIGASNSTYWDEDYYFGVGVGEIAGDPPSYEETTLGNYDRVFHDHGEPFLEWYTTADQMVFAGNLAVTEGAPGSAEYYWEAYCLMGDPSLMVYFSEPPAMTVTYDPLLPIGSETITVNAVPYAYVCISMNNENLGAALADENGQAIVPLSNISGPGSADVVVTAQNYQPFMGTVLIANPQGPYVMLNQYAMDDSNGNNNGLVEAGENILVNAELKNWGNADAANTNAVLSSEDIFVTLIDNSQDYGTIPAQDSVMETSAYQFQVSDSVPDMHVVPFTLDIQGESRDSWGSTFSVILYAPVMYLGTLTVDDSEGGNGNSRLDPGETVNFIMNCYNNGHCDAYEILATLQSSSPYITFENTNVSFDMIAWNGMEQAVFTATLANEIETGTLIELNAALTSAPYSVTKQFNAKVGLVMEDFETGDFTSFGWQMSGTQPWIATGQNVFGGMYSGMSGDISDDETSVLFLDMNVAVNDSISFFRRASCEDDPSNDDYDWLAFYIDDQEMGRWDGEVAWGREAYPVTAGMHTFKWVYNKDYSVSSGLDAGLLDNIIFPAPTSTISVQEITDQPADFFIMPNPARDHAGIYISLKQDATVSVNIYDVAGTLVKVICSEKMMKSGKGKLAIETAGLTRGMYFCILQTGNRQIAKKLIIH